MTQETSKKEIMGYILYFRRIYLWIVRSNYFGNSRLS